MWFLLGALAAARPTPGPAPSDTGWYDHLALVDALAWAATDRQVRSYLRDLRHDVDTPWAQALVPDARSDLRPAGRPLYAAEIEILDDLPGNRPRRMAHVRQAVVYTNTSRVPLEAVTFRLMAAGEHLFAGSAHVLDARRGTRSLEHELDGSLLTVFLDEPLRPGRQARLYLELIEDLPPLLPGAGSPDDDALPIEAVGGFGFTADRLHLAGALAVATRLDRDGGFDRRRLPVNGEAPDLDVGDFHVVLDLPEGHRVGASGLETERVVGDDGRATTVHLAPLTREFAAAGGRDLEVRSIPVDEHRSVRVLFPADEALMGRHLARWSSQAMPVLHDAFGPLSMAEIDLVEGPLRVALGLEFHGVALVDLHHKSGSYFRDPSHPVTVAHELAHQWWSGEVASDSRDAPWIDEALASYGALLVTEQVQGRDAVDALHRDGVFDPTRALRDAGLDDLPADLPGEAYDLWRYSVIVYGRAPYFVDRIRELLGAEAFRDAMTGLVEAHRHGRIDADDLLEAWRRHAADPTAVDALHERWIHGAHAYEDLLESP